MIVVSASSSGRNGTAWAASVVIVSLLAACGSQGSDQSDLSFRTKSGGLGEGIADLVLTAVDKADPITVGGVIEYQARVENLGPDDATSVIVNQAFGDPSALSLVAATASSGSCASVAGGVVCTVPSLPVGASVDLRIQMTALGSGTVTSTFSATAAESDFNEPNSALVMTTVEAVPGVQLPTVGVTTTPSRAVGRTSSRVAPSAGSGPWLVATAM